MPELYNELFRCVKAGELDKALEIQNDCCRIIYKMCSAHGNMYAVIKAILRKQGAPDCGSVRAPLAELVESDMDCCRIIYKMCSAHGNMYAVIKAILRKQGAPDCGSVRAPLAELVESDMAIVDESAAMIAAAIAKYC